VATLPSPTGAGAAGQPQDVAGLLPLLRRVVRARIDDPTLADDLVQETVARVLAAGERIDPALLEPYAIVTARNVIASHWREVDRRRRNEHRVLDPQTDVAADEGILAEADRRAVAEALAMLPEADRHTLLAHEVAGQDTRSLAAERGSTAGAVAAQLNRTRARVRVEYLLALDDVEPPTPRCRPVLYAVSSGDRRRQRDVDAEQHLLECELCARLSRPLEERGQPRDDRIRVSIGVDADIVIARSTSREAAARLGFGSTDLTVIATAVSEVTRNIVRFAGTGEVVVELLEEPRPGVRIVARDAGPGIPDVAEAMRDGFSTYDGLGLGLPGARRLMDEFTVDSEVGRGTTVTMTKWLGGRR
jgi:serine/threonine-protein kinase RsbT